MAKKRRHKNEYDVNEEQRSEITSTREHKKNSEATKGRMAETPG